MGLEEAQHHSKMEAEEAIRGLPASFWAALRRRAMWQLRGNSISEAEDVISEVYERFVITGTRKWPTDVSIDVCFRNAVKSVISGEWDKHKRQLAKQHVPVTAEGEPADALEDVPAITGDPLTELVDAPERQRQQAIIEYIESHFANDEAVTAILIGREAKMSPEEVQQQFELTQTEYDSASRKLRRFINKHYPNGWQPNEQLQQEPQSLA